jgi:solute carrier family 35 protein F5
MAPASPRLQPLSVPSPQGSTEVDVEARYTREVLEQDPVVSPASEVSNWDEQKKPHSRIRHFIGILLLLATVFLWTASNFLASVGCPIHSYSQFLDIYTI